MSIGEFCNRELVCALRDTTVVAAANLMRHHHVGDVIVVDQSGNRRVPVGIITDRDIVVEVVAAGLDPKLLKLGDLLNGSLATVDENEGYASTIYQMVERGVRRMPVVDTSGNLVGIITADDLLLQLSAPLAELSELARRGRQREIQTRK